MDVLIIGAGPAGVMAANGLAKAGVDVRIVDKRCVMCFCLILICSSFSTGSRGRVGGGWRLIQMVLTF